MRQRTQRISICSGAVALLTLLSLVSSPTASAATDDGWLPVDVALRLTQGGLAESRDPDSGSLGGGQLALDIRLGELPLWVSLAGEYYKKQQYAEERYEIDEMSVLYLLYKSPLISSLRSELYAGAGFGQLTTGTDEDAPVWTGAAGVNLKAYRRLGLIVEARYLCSNKTRNGSEVVDFSNRGLLVGPSYNSGW